MNNDTNDVNDEIKIDLDTEDVIDIEPLESHAGPEIDLSRDQEDEDDIISEDESENPKNAIKKLKAELKQAKQEKLETLTNWQKDKADFINARKRDEETKADVIKFSNHILINDLLPIIDGYEQAKMQPTWNQVDEAWRKGIEAIIDKIYISLQKAGVESFGANGEVFNPNLHEALGSEKTDEGLKDNTISMIMQKGYKMHDKVIRPSLVKVYHFE
jgi:molecular chaperone GrpE